MNGKCLLLASFPVVVGFLCCWRLLQPPTQSVSFRFVDAQRGSRIEKVDLLVFDRKPPLFPRLNGWLRGLGLEVDAPSQRHSCGHGMMMGINFAAGARSQKLLIFESRHYQSFSLFYDGGAFYQTLFGDSAIRSKLRFETTAKNVVSVPMQPLLIDDNLR
jgi:hypothetical protein